MNLKYQSLLKEGLSLTKEDIRELIREQVNTLPFPSEDVLSTGSAITNDLSAADVLGSELQPDEENNNDSEFILKIKASSPEDALSMLPYILDRLVSSYDEDVSSYESLSKTGKKVLESLFSKIFENNELFERMAKFFIVEAAFAEEAISSKDIDLLEWSVFRKPEALKESRVFKNYVLSNRELIDNINE